MKKKINAGVVVFMVLMVVIVSTFLVALIGSLGNTYVQLGAGAVIDRIRDGFEAMGYFVGFIAVVSLPVAILCMGWK